MLLKEDRCLKIVYERETNSNNEHPLVTLHLYIYIYIYIYVCIYIFSRNLVEYYCKCCNLIDYATRYLFVDKYRVAKMASASRFLKFLKTKQNAHLKVQSQRNRKMFFAKFVSTKTIRLFALDFYEVIVDSGFALVNHHLIEISSS